MGPQQPHGKMHLIIGEITQAKEKILFKKDTFFHEVAEGPFNMEDTIIANWAPDEKETAMVKKYIANISINVESINS